MQAGLVRLFEQRFGRVPDAVDRVAADGSQRAYFRLTGGGRSVIGARGPDHDENRAFLSFSRSFHSISLPVPEIFAVDEAAGLWLEEDLGDTTLFDALTVAREREPGDFPLSMIPVYERVVGLLPRVQVEGGKVIDYAHAYPRAAFDLQSMRWDLNYYKYHFLKLAHVPFSEQRLENDFDRLAAFLLEADTRHFLYRDFQSRNIMLRDGAPWFIDYQGGRRGAPQYDIASLLYDAKAAIPDSVRAHLLDHYMSALGEHVAVDRDRFRELYRGYVLIRMMQAMGAYGYRGFFERKPRFLQSVPYAARNLAGLLEAGLPVKLPELECVFRWIADTWSGGTGDLPQERGLTIHVHSFSYRRGYPDDQTGHGGGFVFDCRSLPNPGRFAEFAGMTGRSDDVVRFLEDKSEIDAFWNAVRMLVEGHVHNYQQRGFTDLTVAFGCTGGQHRSVYFAERLARHLRTTQPQVSVQLVHRERRSWPELDASAEPAAAASAETTA